MFRQLFKEKTVINRHNEVNRDGLPRVETEAQTLQSLKKKG